MIRRLAFTALASLAINAAPAAAQDATTTQPGDNQVAQQGMPLQANFDMAEDRDNILLLDLSNGGRVAIRLVPEWAPNHVARIKELTRQGFYNGVIFHRVIDGFMAQTGDPTGTGQGGSTLPDLAEEFNMLPHVRGTVSMARAQDDDSANSQFFIVFYPRFALDRRYTNFGRVISGMQYVDQIHRGEPPADPTRILQASLASDNMPQATVAAANPASERISVSDLNNSESAPAAEAPAEADASAGD